ncbi:MAG: DUF2780 domain-containing protein [Methylobacter sp.]
MRKKSMLTLLAISLAAAGNAQAKNWKDVLNEVNNSVNNPANAALQQKTPVSTQPVQAGSLTELLMQRTGVTQTQAQSGAGALFQIAKNHMQESAFSQLEQAVPGMQGLLGAVPPLTQPQGGLAGRLSSLAGNAGGTAGSLVALASAFQQQGMSPIMVQQFIPVVIEYVKARGSDDLVDTLNAALDGR